MTPYLTTLRPPATGWIFLARSLAAPADRRRPDVALAEPMVFRSECFAEDLVETAPPSLPRSAAAARA